MNDTPQPADASYGWIGFQLGLMLSSESGRAKHTDVVEQGAWLLAVFEEALRYVEPGDGLAFTEIRYLGEQEPDTAPISHMEVHPYAGRRGDQKVEVLRKLVRELGRAFVALAESAAIAFNASPDVIEVADWAVGGRPLTALSDSDLRWALDEDG